MAPDAPIARPFSKVCILVLDGAGVGALPDAAAFNDPPTVNTLGNVGRAVGPLALPHFQALGLGNLTEIAGVPAAARPEGYVLRMAEVSNGKDTPTGHWEMVGVRTTEPFVVYNPGFPKEIVDAFSARTGYEVLGNCVASGTTILDELGPEHIRTGKLILYTSADSVFQVAAHEEIVAVEELHRVCAIARDLLDRYRVGRVIARPFVGQPGSFKRTYHRKDFSMLPPAGTLLDRMCAVGLPVLGIGKVQDIFAGQGVPESLHSEGNTDGLRLTLAACRDRTGLIFTNLVDFDALYGHRRNPKGFSEALVEVDRLLPALLEALGQDGLLCMTADHGNDPTYLATTDHTREFVPLLFASRRFAGRGGHLPDSPSFAALGQTLAENFAVAPLDLGESYLAHLLG